MDASGGGAVRRALRALGGRALEFAAPTRCASCERPGTLICPDCLARLELIDPVHACVRCGAAFGDLLCTECDPAAPHSCDRVLACAGYVGPAPRIVRAYKDGGERRLGLLIAELLLDTARHAEATAPGRYGGILSGADAIAFVPATGEAYSRRGFDHMELVARELSRLSGVPLADALAKRGRSDQRRLGRAGRLAGGSSAYVAMADVSGSHLLLVDDVVTTGATVQAAASALRAAGAAAVDALALARVW